MVSLSVMNPLHVMLRSVSKYILLVSISTLSLVAEPNRWADQIGEFTARDETNPAPRGAVVCVGSSSMRMWDPRIAEDLKPLTVVSLGFGGSQFTDLNFYFDELVARYQPRAVLVYEGDNDIGSGKTPITVARDFLTFVEKTHALDPEIRIYFISIKPSIVRVALLPEASRANDMIAAICDHDPRLNYIDVATSLLDRKGAPNKKLFLEDDLHLNQLGYDKWANAIRMVIVPLEKPFESESK